MITLKQGIKLSAIVDKMDLKINKEFTDNQQTLGADMILQFIGKAHKAENEVYELVADIKEITSKEAEKIKLADFINELFGNQDMLDFFKSAVKSNVQE